MRTLTQKIKKDIKTYNIKNATELTHFFYNNYVSLDNFDDVNQFIFVKLTNANTKIEDLYDFNKKIKFLLEKNYIIEE